MSELEAARARIAQLKKRNEKLRVFIGHFLASEVKQKDRYHETKSLTNITSFSLGLPRQIMYLLKKIQKYEPDFTFEVGTQDSEKNPNISRQDETFVDE